MRVQHASTVCLLSQALRSSEAHSHPRMRCRAAALGIVARVLDCHCTSLTTLPSIEVERVAAPRSSSAAAAGQSQRSPSAAAWLCTAQRVRAARAHANAPRKPAVAAAVQAPKHDQDDGGAAAASSHSAATGPAERRQRSRRAFAPCGGQAVCSARARCGVNWSARRARARQARGSAGLRAALRQLRRRCLTTSRHAARRGHAHAHTQQRAPISGRSRSRSAVRHTA
jgi:hypothetical protein